MEMSLQQLYKYIKISTSECNFMSLQSRLQIVKTKNLRRGMPSGRVQLKKKTKSSISKNLEKRKCLAVESN